MRPTSFSAEKQQNHPPHSRFGNLLAQSLMVAGLMSCVPRVSYGPPEVSKGLEQCPQSRTVNDPKRQACELDFLQRVALDPVTKPESREWIIGRIDGIMHSEPRNDKEARSSFDALFEIGLHYPDSSVRSLLSRAISRGLFPADKADSCPPTFVLHHIGNASQVFDDQVVLNAVICRSPDASSGPSALCITSGWLPSSRTASAERNSRPASSTGSSAWSPMRTLKGRTKGKSSPISGFSTAASFSPIPFPCPSARAPSRFSLPVSGCPAILTLVMTVASR